MTIWNWGSVTALGPLRVQLDGDSSPIPFAPDSLIDPRELTVGARVRCEISSGRLIIHGKGGGGFGVVLGVIDAHTAALAAAANKIINGDGRVNQRGASSGTSLASGAYFLDRWKSLSSTNAVTWTGDGTVGRVLTIPSSKAIAQIIERTDMPAGDYTLVWTGTAGARVYNVGAGSPPALSSGVNVLTVTLDGAADVVVEFGPGTVSKVALYAGATAFPYRGRRFGDELRLCQRYYEAGSYYWWIAGSTSVRLLVPFKATKRAVPTMTSLAIGSGAPTYDTISIEQAHAIQVSWSGVFAADWSASAEL